MAIQSIQDVFQSPVCELIFHRLQPKDMAHLQLTCRLFRDRVNERGWLTLLRRDFPRKEHLYPGAYNLKRAYKEFFLAEKKFSEKCLKLGSSVLKATLFVPDTVVDRMIAIHMKK